MDVSHVLQGASPLLEDERLGCFRLLDPFEPVTIGWRSGETATIRLDRSLLFKLGRSGAQRGRLVRQASPGIYVLFTRGERAGEPHSGDWPGLERFDRPTPVSGIPGVMSHQISVRELPTKQAGLPFSIGAPPVRLEGPSVLDDGLMGPLFGPDLPRLVASPEVWQDISTVVVGEEGEGIRGHLHVDMRPNRGREEQVLPPDFAALPSGWYCVRLYDSSEELVDSLDFRFVSGLEALTVEPHPPWPGPHGHKPVTLRVIARENVVLVSPEGREHAGQNFSVSIPPDPKYDSTEWSLSRPGGRPVRVRLTLTRVWWSFSPQGPWSDLPLRIEPVALSSESRTALYFRLPQNAQATPFKVGFSRFYAREPARQGSLRVIELRSLAYDPVLSRAEGCASLKVYLPEGSVVVALFQFPAYNCTLCGEEFPLLEEAALHLLQRHEAELFRPGMYDDVVRADDKLPKAIYKCTLCEGKPFMVAVDPFDRHWRALDDHWRSEHLTHTRSATGLRFLVVRDLDEIRAAHVPGVGLIPYMYVCRNCSATLTAEKEADVRPKLLEHLKNHHLDLVRRAGPMHP